MNHVEEIRELAELASDERVALGRQGMWCTYADLDALEDLATRLRQLADAMEQD